MKPKLAYLCSSVSWGGLEMNHLRNAQWMQERGHEVYVIGVKDSRFLNDASAMGLLTIPIQAHKKYYDFKQARNLANLLQTNEITHLLLRSTFDMSIAATVKRYLGNKIHTSYFMEMQMGVKKKHLLHTIRYKYIDLWSCPLNWLEDQVKTMTKFKNKTVVIPSGLDLTQFASMPSKADARKLLNLPESPRIFGLIGRFDPQKGQLLLLEAMKHCTNKDFHIVFLGEPTHNEGDDYHKEMLKIIEQPELKDRVHVRPFMKDVLPFFSAVDWFVMATKAETFGMVTIESLASGTPVLGSNAGGTPEILEQDKGGVLFETQNPRDLALKIDAICEQNISPNPKVLKEMAASYDHENVCEMVEEALNINWIC